MLNSGAVNSSVVASVESFAEVSSATGNAIIYAQRYAADGSTIGSPIQVTSDDVAANPVSTTLLSDGKFVVAYNSVDPNDTSTPYPFFQLATKEFGADGAPIATNELGLNDFNTFKNYKAVPLSDGSYGYLLETFVDDRGSFSDTKTFGFVDAAGHLEETVLAVTSNGDTPLPQLHQSTGSIRLLPDGGFVVSFTEAYTEGSPDYPPPEPVPTGEQQFNRVYDRDGDLKTTVFVDFDGTKTIERFDPATGMETASAIFNTDGSRLTTQFGITGRYYVEQSIATDPSGAITEQKRYYGDAEHTLAFSLTNNPDGTTEVHNYDTAGRETVRQIGNLRAEHDVYQFAYANAAGTAPSTTTLTHYGADNTKTFVDITKADSSHSQRSYADGVTLISHEGVADTLSGFAKGSDAFAFGPDFGKDVVNGFAAGAGPNHDVLRFDAALAADYASLLSHITQVGPDTLISFGNADSVLLKGVSTASILPENVQFTHDAGLLV
ncbi:hypothetical protein [Aureimonas leprariae]|uniref:YD repeat-containing protein n=1 Tax=Plantimonas leprariae TaxID=2615207 RepID=A0A7V7PMK6_9HYPH|nr:hypothetical protein [Aureimonas leprariae]KAB0678091.1 hypothetical protein F6X38_16840 [Aureimonas leprariae]